MYIWLSTEQNWPNWLCFCDDEIDLTFCFCIKVAPAELEGVILKHPKVADAGVIGIPHPVDCELPKAFIVKRDESLTVEDINALVQGNNNAYRF